jgi:hypothetical protein
MDVFITVSGTLTGGGAALDGTKGIYIRPIHIVVCEGP